MPAQSAMFQRLCLWLPALTHTGARLVRCYCCQSSSTDFAKDESRNSSVTTLTAVVVMREFFRTDGASAPWNFGWLSPLQVAANWVAFSRSFCEKPSRHSIDIRSGWDQESRDDGPQQQYWYRSGSLTFSTYGPRILAHLSDRDAGWSMNQRHQKIRSH